MKTSCIQKKKGCSKKKVRKGSDCALLCPCPTQLKYKAVIAEVCGASEVDAGYIGFDSLESRDVRWIIISRVSKNGCKTKQITNGLSKGDVVRLAKSTCTNENLDYCIMRTTCDECHVFLYVRALENNQNHLICEGEEYVLLNFGPKVASVNVIDDNDDLIIGDIGDLIGDDLIIGDTGDLIGGEIIIDVGQ